MHFADEVPKRHEYIFLNAVRRALMVISMDFPWFPVAPLPTILLQLFL
jgi:hypothetical protein